MSRWVLEHEHKAKGSSERENVANSDLSTQITELLKKNDRLTMERDILKKAVAFFARESI